MVGFESRVLVRQLKERKKGNYNLAIYSQFTIIHNYSQFTIKLEEIQIKRLARNRISEIEQVMTILCR